MGCSEKKTEITILGESATSIQSMIALEGEYERNYPGVDLIFKPNSFDDAFNKANQDFMNKTGLYDIVMQYNFSLTSFVKNDYVASLDSILAKVPKEKLSFEKDLYPSAWREIGFYSAGNTDSIIKVGYPFTANTMFLSYNKDLFNDPVHKANFLKRYKHELTIPSTWEELYQIAEFFTQPDKKIKGICLQGATGSWLYYEWMNFLFGMGGRVMDKAYGWQGDANTQIHLNSIEALKAAKFYLSLKPFNSGNFTNVDAYEQIEILKQGKVAIAIIWSDLAFKLVDKGDGQFDERFGFAPIPGGKSMLGGGSYFINKKSKHGDLAAEYIVDLMQKENQIKLAKTGLCSGLRTVYDDTEVKKIPYSYALAKSLERGTYMLEAGIDATLISDKITASLQKMWGGQLSPEAAIKDMQAQIVTGRNALYTQIQK